VHVGFRRTVDNNVIGHVRSLATHCGASRNRLRPITMTTLAAILTLFPLALAIVEGSAMQQPLAVAIIAGLVLQFPMVVLALPALLSLTLPTEVVAGLGC
jgi:multidrug efflux pump subunit AcrB